MNFIYIFYLYEKSTKNNFTFLNHKQYTILLYDCNLYFKRIFTFKNKKNVIEILYVIIWNIILN